MEGRKTRFRPRLAIAGARLLAAVYHSETNPDPEPPETKPNSDKTGAPEHPNSPPIDARASCIVADCGPNRARRVRCSGAGEKIRHAPPCAAAARSLVEAMGALPAGLPPLPPHLGTLRSTPDQRGAQEPLLGLDWSVADGDGGAGEQAAWGVGDGSARGVVGRLRRAARAVRSLVVEMWEFARKDPRKPVFAAKVAVALALITLLVFLREPSDIASHSVWAILTVVVVFEFSIGTLLHPCFAIADVSSLFPETVSRRRRRRFEISVHD